MAAPKGELKAHVPSGCSVKIVGLGGVGSIVAQYLTIFLRSCETDTRMVLIDGDEFEQKNAERMLFERHGNKAEVVHERLYPFLQTGKVELVAISQFVTPENISRLIREDDIVILGVDNNATRKLIDDHCGTLKNVCLISGGNDGVEELPSGKMLRGTYGNAHICVRKDGENVTPSLSQFHAEIKNPADKNPADLNCTELITSVPQVLFANLAAASSILNTLWLYFCNATHYYEVCFDIAEGKMHSLEVKR